MDEDADGKSLLKRVIPRAVKAIVWGFLMGGEVLILYGVSPEFRGFSSAVLPIEEQSFFGLMLFLVAFEVAIQFTSGTIFPYALSGARALILMAFFYYATNVGVISVGTPSGETPVRVIVDLRTVLAVLLMFSLLTLAKNVLQAIDFLSKKTEQSFPSSS